MALTPLTGMAPAAQVSAPPAPRKAVTTPAWKHVDVVLVAAAGAVSCIGLLMVYATTRFSLAVAGESPTSELKRQALYTVFAVAAFAATLLFDYRRYLTWAPALYVGSLLMLAATLVIGRETLGAESWIQVGPIQVEPSEVVKVTLTLSLAALLARWKGHVPGRAILAVLGLSVIPFLLIYKEDALGSAIVLAIVMVAMLLMAGVRGRHMVVLTLVAVLGIAGVVQSGLLHEYQKSRLTTFLTAPSGVSGNVAASNPYAATIEYNLDQSKAAIADGGVYGKGLFNGYMTNLSYVPNQSTDFIFTAVAEQFGFFGSAVLLALFALIVWRTWRAATLSRDLAGTLICAGVLAIIMFQVFENVGMTMGIMPVAGITLPFMSYGGSSMVVDWVAIGLVVNVRMRRFA